MPVANTAIAKDQLGFLLMRYHVMKRAHGTTLLVSTISAVVLLSLVAATISTARERSISPTNSIRSVRTPATLRSKLIQRTAGIPILKPSRVRTSAPSSPKVQVKDYVSGRIYAPGGPFFYDSHGRVVIFHGVNAVYKHPPFVLYPDPGKPWSFTAKDAKEIASLGFNVVRLGILWQGLEPGYLGPNSPSICTRGTPGHAHQYNQATINNYLDKVAATVNLLGRYHIYTILDMHQDVYNQVFRGEGEPAWAVCTNGLPIDNLLGRWSRDYREPAVGAAFANLWTNDVIGNLQGNYDRVWQQVALKFADNPWILGYDLFNEPFAPSLLPVSHHEVMDTELECFYTGKANPGLLVNYLTHIPCPKDDPAIGLIPTIEQADPNHLIIYEPDLISRSRLPSYLGPMPFPRLVYSFHDYCAFRDPLTGNPIPAYAAACEHQEQVTIALAARERAASASPFQPDGPPWFMGEFGATNDFSNLAATTAEANKYLLSWAYWAWKYYDDPTGSTDEALAAPNGHLYKKVFILSQTYAQAIAGRPLSMYFDPYSGYFHLLYLPSHSIHEPTIIFVPVALHYPHGYCVAVSGGNILSKPDASHLLIQNLPDAHRVSVSIEEGHCAEVLGAKEVGAKEVGAKVPVADRSSAE
jgi:endoglycosylceramidase